MISTRIVRFAPTVRPPRPPALWNVGPARPPFTVWPSTITIEGVAWRPWLSRTSAPSSAIARRQTWRLPSRHRRHCCQTAGQGG